MGSETGTVVLKEHTNPLSYGSPFSLTYSLTYLFIWNQIVQDAKVSLLKYITDLIINPALKTISILSCQKFSNRLQNAFHLPQHKGEVDKVFWYVFMNYFNLKYLFQWTWTETFSVKE